MMTKIIFDLSEVLILGLIGIEEPLSALVPTPESDILACFGGQRLQEMFCGRLTEPVYLQQIIAQEQWDIQPETLQTIIRENFHREVEGTIPILRTLAARYETVLLSDHAREWVTYIKTVHPFLSVFERTFFSYDLGTTKKDRQTFLALLEQMNYPASDCLLIDDRPQNIEVAGSVGIAGIQFKNAQQLRQALAERQLL